MVFRVVSVIKIEPTVSSLPSMTEASSCLQLHDLLNF